jgi:putative acetyltransferase
MRATLHQRAGNPLQRAQGIGGAIGLNSLRHDRMAHVACGRPEMSKSAIRISAEDPRQADIRRIIAESDAMMQALYPAESNHLVDADELAAAGAVFLAARRDGEALGSIAYLRIAPGHAEMKRLFVRQEGRGMGLGRRLLDTLEDIARAQGIVRISLETGVKQMEAIGLYRACGYRDCLPFAAYQHDPLSLFMTKRLVGP